MVDAECFERNHSKKGSAKERFILQLKISFDTEHVEDGINHPAEKIIDDALNSKKRQSIMEVFDELSVDVEHPNMAASVLRCLGRRKSESLGWRISIVKAALAVDNVEIRDAAVQAAEGWGEMEFCKLLEHHSEVVPWLRTYIENVIKYLKESV